MELTDNLSKFNDKLDKLIELQTVANHLQEGANVSLHESYRVLKCTKKGNNQRHSFGFKLSVGMAIIAIAALIMESINKGEASVVLSILKAARGFM